MDGSPHQHVLPYAVPFTVVFGVRVVRLHQLLLHEHRRSQPSEFSRTTPAAGRPVLVVRGSCGAVHLRAGADHAVPVGRGDEAARRLWGFVYGAKYGLVGSFNDFFGTNIDVLQPSVLLASIGNISTWEFTGYNMLIFYSSLSTIPHSLYEAASIDGASEWQIVKSIKLPELKGSLAITVIFSIIGSFQLFNEPSILQNMVPGNAITTYYTPNMYAYNLSFSGNQSNYAAALAIVMAVITMAIAYAVQLKSMKEQMK